MVRGAGAPRCVLWDGQGCAAEISKVIGGAFTTRQLSSGGSSGIADRSTGSCDDASHDCTLLLLPPPSEDLPIGMLTGSGCKATAAAEHSTHAPDPQLLRICNMQRPTQGKVECAGGSLLANMGAYIDFVSVPSPDAVGTDASAGMTALPQQLPLGPGMPLQPLHEVAYSTQ